MKIKKIISIFMLTIGMPALSYQVPTADNGDSDLYAIVYPTTLTTSLRNLYNIDPTAADEIDKFLNNQPSLLDATNPAASGTIGLGKRKLYLYIHDNFHAFTPVAAYAYIYYDALAKCAKIHVEGFIISPEKTIHEELIYEKILIEREKATANNWSTMPNMLYGTKTEPILNDSVYQANYSEALVKIKTSIGFDTGSEYFASATNLTFGTERIGCYKMLAHDDYFFHVYHKPKA